MQGQEGFEKIEEEKSSQFIHTGFQAWQEKAISRGTKQSDEYVLSACMQVYWMGSAASVDKMLRD